MKKGVQKNIASLRDRHSFTANKITLDKAVFAFYYIFTQFYYDALPSLILLPIVFRFIIL